jgi:hypothetical protein
MLLRVVGAAAQTAQSPTPQNPGAVSQVGSATAQASAQPPGSAGPQINIAEITARANRDVGVNIDHYRFDPPPLKWSDLRYVFDIEEDRNGKEAIQA